MQKKRLLHDPEGDIAFFNELKSGMPTEIDIVEIATFTEDPVFVKAWVDRLIGLIEASP